VEWSCIVKGHKEAHAGHVRDRGGSRISRKPDFFIVGAPKSGTSSLYQYLMQHPDVFMSDPKEPHFFYNRNAPGSPVLGVKDLDKYLKLFEGVSEEVRAGEASTSYLWLTNAAQEIRQLQPEAKIIMLLRDPVDRAYSHYWHQVRDDKEPLGFDEALHHELERVRRGLWHGLYYVENGRYAEQVTRYLETFGAESVRVYLFEDLIRDPWSVCRSVFGLLGVDPDAPVEARRAYNRGGVPRSRLFAKLIRSPVKEPLKKVLPETFRRNLGDRIRGTNNKPIPEMNFETKHYLREVFREDVLRLEEIIGRDLRHWR
jgi:hypothetical protein